MTEKVTIIGAGIVGICTALSLLEKGVRVEVIDRNPPAEGASHGNAGVVSPWTCVPQSMPGLWRQVPGWLLNPEGPVALRWGYLPRFMPWAIKFLRAGAEHRVQDIGAAMHALNRPNVDLYRYHLAGTGGEHLLRDSMYVHVFRDAAAANLNGLGWRMRSDRGVPLQVIRGGELQDVEPALSGEFQAAILIKDQARAANPKAIGKTLAAKAEGMGANFRRAAVHKIAPQEGGGWQLTSDEGELPADKVVIAAGAWSQRLLAPLGIDLPLEAERGYHLICSDPGITIQNSVMDVEAKFVASSMDMGVRLAGTAEFAGLDAPPDYRRARVFEGLAKRLFPEIQTEKTEEWMGSRPSFPDSLPCLGVVPGYTGLYAAFGHSHYGFGMAPNTGRVVAEVVCGGTPNIDMLPYRVDRFA